MQSNGDKTTSKSNSKNPEYKDRFHLTRDQQFNNQFLSTYGAGRDLFISLVKKANGLYAVIFRRAVFSKNIKVDVFE